VTKHSVYPAGKSMSAARQTGMFEVHPADCPCRKCRRATTARARRAKPRYGQRPDAGTSETERNAET
jgi:hypothetical protein